MLQKNFTDKTAEVINTLLLTSTFLQEVSHSLHNWSRWTAWCL